MKIAGLTFLPPDMVFAYHACPGFASSLEEMPRIQGPRTLGWIRGDGNILDRGLVTINTSIRDIDLLHGF
jgi:hypothetical protein